MIVSIVISINNENRRTREVQAEKESVLKAYSEIKSQIKLSDNCLKILFKGGSSNIPRGLNYIWKQNGNICFFPTSNCIEPLTGKYKHLKIEIQSINIDDIVSFERRGEIAYENKISGGGGGGSSIGKAIVGGVIAGGAGAIIGSRNKMNEINSEFISHDNRECVLALNKGNEKSVDKFEYNGYNIFMDLIPEKEITIVDENRRRNIINKQLRDDSDIIKKIRDFSSLKDEGILTQEEFEKIKNELLNEVKN